MISEITDKDIEELEDTNKWYSADVVTTTIGYLTTALHNLKVSKKNEIYEDGYEAGYESGVDEADTISDLAIQDAQEEGHVLEREYIFRVINENPEASGDELKELIKKGKNRD